MRRNKPQKRGGSGAVGLVYGPLLCTLLARVSVAGNCQLENFTGSAAFFLPLNDVEKQWSRETGTVVQFLGEGRSRNDGRS